MRSSQEFTTSDHSSLVEGGKGEAGRGGWGCYTQRGQRHDITELDAAEKKLNTKLGNFVETCPFVTSICCYTSVITDCNYHQLNVIITM
jgi:hypothetical protein